MFRDCLLLYDPARCWGDHRCIQRQLSHYSVQSDNVCILFNSFVWSVSYCIIPIWSNVCLQVDCPLNQINSDEFAQKNLARDESTLRETEMFHHVHRCWCIHHFSSTMFIAHQQLSYDQFLLIQTKTSDFQIQQVNK